MREKMLGLCEASRVLGLGRGRPFLFYASCPSLPPFLQYTSHQRLQSSTRKSRKARLSFSASSPILIRTRRTTHSSRALSSSSDSPSKPSAPNPHRYPSSFIPSIRMSTTTTDAQTAAALIESAKASAAKQAVADHFQPTYRFVGIGSGTTIVYVVKAIQSLPGLDASAIRFVPTGSQSEKVILDAGLTPLALSALPDGTLLDVAFDGADEVDDDLNCIKGGGACLYQEKLVATQARRFVAVADSRKLQPRLLTNWLFIPIEVEPLATKKVTAALLALGCTKPVLRVGADGQPVRTDQSFYLIDAYLPPLLTAADVSAAGGIGQAGAGQGGKWEVNALAAAIKQVEGVLSVGIFAGPTGDEIATQGGRIGGARPVAAYFGMPDGSVQVRSAK